MVQHHVINCLNRPKLGLELVQVGLEHLDLHVVHVVLAELEHTMAQGVRLL